VINNLKDLSQTLDYSFIHFLIPDPSSTSEGDDHKPRQVSSGHYVLVKPEPIHEPIYIIHSKSLFEELSISDDLAQVDDFKKTFSANLSQCPELMNKYGWACGYALSIYGTEYTNNCPFGTGNGYGDGRAISIYEGVINGKRLEMQLKGAGKTPYCRGADGRAVLRSSIREFLAQEHMYALGVPTSRSLTLYTSKSETVQRPWFHPDSHSTEPELMIEEPIAISTRVAPSFIRVGQIELFARRVRNQAHPQAMNELQKIVSHLITREYPEINTSSSSPMDKLIRLAIEFRSRLTSLMADWIRVGYCQGNFNSDNTALGGFTLDYGPFGFIDEFKVDYQPWTGGGTHYSFFNQPQAAFQNFKMFCHSLSPLFEDNQIAIEELNQVILDFPEIIQQKMMDMWASKLGLETFQPSLFNELIQLLQKTSVDYTIFFRELSNIPEQFSPLTKSFYQTDCKDKTPMGEWLQWHEQWLNMIRTTNPEDINATTPESTQKLSEIMKGVNPKYILREWFMVPAYQLANEGKYDLIREINEVMTNPYAEQSKEFEDKYYQKKPLDLFNIAGVSHVSCSS
jgi:uncharacterized protein YdiU (UPF0061 family)